MENWKEIDGYNGFYSVSDTGKIRANERKVYAGIRTKSRKAHAHEKKPSIAANGYLVVLLHYRGSYKTKAVHRLVAEAFIDNPDNLPVVNHIDGNKLNNHVSNLEWCSYAQNSSHAVRHRLRTYSPVRCVETGKAFKTEKDAGEYYGLKSGSSIGKAIRTGRKAAGYHWTPVAIDNRP